MTENANIIKSTDENAATKAASVLARSGVIIYPTETLYGIGTLALDTFATHKIFNIKERARNKPILVLVRDLEMLNEYFKISKKHLSSYKKIVDMPLTLILNEKLAFPDVISSGTHKTAVRISSNNFVIELFNHINEPITSTSANLSDSDNILDINEIINTFVDKVDLIVDSGNLPHSKGSTIIDLTLSPFQVIREGDTPIEIIQEYF